MNKRRLRPSRSAGNLNLIFADIAMVALCVTAMWWLLFSPLIPIAMDLSTLTVIALALGIPLGLLGVYLNHLAARGQTNRAK